MALPILESGDISPDAMFKIFLETPVETLKKYYLVSKNWANFLSHPSFNRLYFEKNSKDHVLAFPGILGSHKQLCFLKKIGPNWLSHQKLPLACQGMHLMGSYEGVLGFYGPPENLNYSGKGLIWNPTTKVGKLFDLPTCDILSIGLGYDTINEDFKVIQLLNSSHGTLIQVYSCKENSWTEPQNVPFFVPDCQNCRFVLNGVPHWEGTADIENISAVFSFDPTTKSHIVIPYPVNNSLGNVFLVKVGDDIVTLAYSETNETCDAYFYESVGWVKKYTIDPLVTMVEDIKIMQFFEGALVTWNIYSDIDFHHVTKNESLPISDLITHVHTNMKLSYIHVETLFGVPGGQPFYPCSMREIIRDFECRRTSLIRALTTDIEELYRKCDPAANEPISLYGLPNNEWKIVKHKREPRKDSKRWVKVLQGPPKPACGINFARKKMEEYDWLSFVAERSDNWLICVALFYAGLYGFNQVDRERLFTLIHDLPTVYDSVTGATEKVTKQVPVTIERPRSLQLKVEDEEGLKVVDDKHKGAIICEACGESSGHDEFAVCCDGCQKIFYQNCVKITLPRSEDVEQNICSSCSKKRARQ